MRYKVKFEIINAINGEALRQSLPQDTIVNVAVINEDRYKVTYLDDKEVEHSLYFDKKQFLEDFEKLN